MNVGVLSADFKTAALGDLEKIVFNRESRLEFLSSISSKTDINECVILSTCNRIECYFQSQNPLAAADQLFKEISKFKAMAEPEVRRILKLTTDTDRVIDHLFHVVSGTKSMVFGENEILGQVKKALEQSQEAGITEATLNKVFQVAISTGKRVRSETDISKGAYSVSSIAIEGIRNTFPDTFQDMKTLIVGAGTMGLRSLKKLSALNVKQLQITNRSEEKLSRLADKYNVDVVPYNDLSTAILESDVIVMATSSTDYLITPDHLRQRKVQPRMIVDLGIPRNVSPHVETENGVPLLSLKGLEKIANDTIQNRKNEIDKINLIIDEEYAKLKKWVEYKESSCLKQSA